MNKSPNMHIMLIRFHSHIDKDVNSIRLQRLVFPLEAFYSVLKNLF